VSGGQVRMAFNITAAVLNNYSEIIDGYGKNA
jgi:hypothetical protein